MLLAHHPDAWGQLRRPRPDAPLRMLVSGCLAAWPCGVDGSDYGLGASLADLLRLPTVRALPFCPEQHSLGTPRSMPDIHGGDGVDVWEGRARVLDEHGVDLTAAMKAGAAAMVAFAQAEGAELAVLTDASAACGSQVISDGCRLVPVRRHQKGVGVATAALLAAGLPVLAQRDHRSLARLRAHLSGSALIDDGLLDHHEHPWVREHLPGLHPRAAG
jgi:uncharacterized protein YbbK (DUF523 family)